MPCFSGSYEVILTVVGSSPIRQTEVLYKLEPFLEGAVMAVVSESYTRTRNVSYCRICGQKWYDSDHEDFSKCLEDHFRSKHPEKLKRFLYLKRMDTVFNWILRSFAVVALVLCLTAIGLLIFKGRG